MVGDPPISMGRYASCEEAAREDAAWGMLKKLQNATGKLVIDFNFYNFQGLESRISELESQNFDLVFENALLKKQIRTLKGVNSDDDDDDMYWLVMKLAQICICIMKVILAH